MATNAKIVATVLVVGLLVGAGVTAVLGQGVSAPGTPTDPDDPSEPTVDDGVTTFESESAYQEYVQSSGYHGGIGGFDGNLALRTDVTMTVESAAQATGDGGDGMDVPSTEQSEPSRIGGANVQEQGIDEPDLVATVGQHLVYAPGGGTTFRHPQPVEPVAEGDEKPKFQTPPSHVVDASEPASPELVAEIDRSGKLLRSGDTLVVLGAYNVTGYDVSDPDDPTMTWEKSLNSSIETARISDGQLYVVTRTAAHRPCPIRPMESSTIACTDVYHPRVQIDADATYTAYSIAPADGAIADSTSFVGTARSTVVYVSNGSLYVTYTKDSSRTELQVDFLVEEAAVVPVDVKERLRQIDSYDISARAKQIEMQRAVEGWMNSLSEAERMAARESLSMGMQQYAKAHQREVATTGIVRIGIGDGDLSIDATGSVAGRPLNQFSMDEHEGTLRIATTIPQVYGAESENDLYTLDAESLDTLGAETGMGVDERIYSVRYVGDTAYMVTFRQIDPFHVVDLSDPQNPTELGNVELPGFSNYLHPVGEDTILGVGEEEGQVKAVLFDVSDPSNPTVADSKVLDARWSAVSQTHHAFMQDARHGVAFLPAGEEGIVLDYTNQSLAVETRIQLDAPPERARYVGDYLYVFSPAEIQVVDETNWEEETAIDLDE